MRISDLIRAAKERTDLSVICRDEVHYVTETKRGGAGIVIWKDNSIQRTDIPLTHQRSSGMRVRDAARLLGL